MRGFVNEFKKFILRGNVVDLAVGIVIGAAFGKVVDSLVADLFMPMVGVLTGGLDLTGMSTGLYGDARLHWGKFLQAILNFVIVGFCMFLVVKGMNALHHRFLKEEAAKPPPEPSPAEKLLAEIRDLLKSRQS
ncbi:MAG: large-conductance mechanosensitive channel protein MscL [Gemmataceae bacterium]|nr:large-conductance mechanosensitive channel protein MscL [Gemmataceae bacterium]